MLELLANRPVVGDRVRAIGRCGFDQVDEQTGPFDVAEELVPQTVPLVRPLDQAGDVGDDERTVRPGVDRPKVWVLGRERVVGDLGVSAGDSREQGRFAGVGQADQADVGDDFQFQVDPAFLAGEALLGLCGARLVLDL